MDVRSLTSWRRLLEHYFNMKSKLGSAVAEVFFGTLLAVSIMSPQASVAGETLTGAGSSAAAPVYKAWATAYAEKQDFQLSYDPAGSSAGVKKIKANEVAFGASDVAPSEQDLIKDQLVLVPTFISGVAPSVNLPKIPGGKLRLSGEVLVDIYSGKITRWNAPEIQNLNPGLALPDIEIIPVVRSDGSGTTYYFTDYLSHVSPEWKTKFGARNTIAWVPACVGAKGNDGVARMVKDRVGAIGYVDFNYVAEYGLSPVQLRNASGRFLSPGVGGFRAALRASDWSSKGDFHATLADLPGNDAWPITMGTFILLPKVSQRAEETSRALRFFVWTLLKGDKVVEQMSFVRLPDKLQATAYKALTSVTDMQGVPLGLQAMQEATRQ
jgi:phosphate transport system substrate-binding protein